MPFTLEIMKAKHGDCLILHHGTKSAPRVMLIDGGPSGVFKEVLEPRLLDIKNSLKEEPLPLSLVMVSHLDDDHINGILSLTESLLQDKSDLRPMPFTIQELWCNNFDDIIGNLQLPAIAAFSAGTNVASVVSHILPKLSESDSHTAAVISSVGQGRDLRKNAGKLGISMNSGFKPAKNNGFGLIRGDTDQAPIQINDLKLTVIHPNEMRLQALQKEWDKQLKFAAKKDNSIKLATVAELMTSSDTSPYNLSSIVCLVEMNNKKILLTGDARMDDIEAGLKFHKLLDKDGRLVIDIFKLPHHGSIRNATSELLQMIKAEHFVISADGSYDNPDKPLLEMIEENVTQGTIYLTYRNGKLDLKKKLLDFEKKLLADNSKLKIVYRNENDPSILINLEEPLTY